MIPPNDPRIKDIVYLIQKSLLDDTIKSILIRDLETEGLTDFLREQILVYCDAMEKAIDERLQAAQAHLAQDPTPSPSSNP